MLSNGKRIVYQPPARDVIRKFAKDVGETLAASGDPSFADADVIIGLADFLGVIADIEVKRLNGLASDDVDKDPE